MRVNIGKYPSRLTCNLHRNHMEKKYGFDWPAERDLTKFDKLVEQVEDFIQQVYHPFNVFYFDKRKQKVDVRIDRWDTWSMDHTLAPIILPMLRQLKETKHGAPIADAEDVPEHLRPSDDEVEACRTNGETDEKFFDRWDWIMDEMIFAFESINNDWEEQFMSGDVDFHSVPVDANGNEIAKEDAKMFRMETGPNDTFEIDWKGHKAYADRVQNGFRLFGKYFNSLWD